MDRDIEASGGADGCEFVSHTFSALNRPFSVRSNDSGFISEVDDRFDDLRTPDVAAPIGRVEFAVRRAGPDWLTHPWGIWRDGTPVETTVTDGYVLSLLLWEVTKLAIESAAPALALHGAVVERQGRAVLLAGPSGAGKSTLAGWAGRRGWGYLSDELAIVSPSEDRILVTAFPRPVGIRSGSPLAELVSSAPAEGDTLVPASSLGLITPSAELVAVVLIGNVGSAPSFEWLPGNKQVDRLAELSAGQALALLVDQLGEQTDDELAQSFDQLSGVLERVPSQTMFVDQLPTAVDALEQMVDDLVATEESGVPR